MSGRLPTWLAEKIGISASEAGGVTWQLDSAWRWAPSATILLILVAITWIIFVYARESTSAGSRYRTLLIGLRIAAVCLVLVMLAQFALALRLTGPPAIALVIDRSASMGIADHYGDPKLAARLQSDLRQIGLEEPTRLNIAKSLITINDARFLRHLATNYELELYFAAKGIERQPRSADLGKSIEALRALNCDGADSLASRLGDAVQYVLDNPRNTPPAALIFISDGVTTDGIPLSEAARHARHKGVPLFIVGLGSSEPARDIELADMLVDDVVFVDDLVSVQAQIKASGLAGQIVKLTLRREGEPSPLAEETITLPKNGQILTSHLIHRPTRPGDTAYIVEVAAQDSETNSDNNRQRRVVSVRDEKINTLLVHAYPNYEFRFLKSLLERDSSIHLATYLQSADADYAQVDKTALSAFPITRDDLFKYDVVILGDVDPRLLPRSVWPNMQSFVAEKGGGVAMLAGPRYLPWLYRDNAEIAALLPIEIDAPATSDGKLPDDIARGFAVRPTPLGLQHPAMQLGISPTETEQLWSHLAPLYWLYRFGDLKPGAQVLAERAGSSATPADAVICFQYVGAGRVLFHSIDSTWRWRLGTGDALFSRYWVQTIRFLARGKLARGGGVQMTADRREYRPGETVQLRVRFLDQRLAPTGDEVTVVLEAHGQSRRRVTLRRNASAGDVFEASLADLTDGQYQALLASVQLPGDPPSAQFTIVAPPGEMARTEMDAAALASAAEITHGSFYTVAETDRLLSELPVGRSVPIETLPPIPLWNSWWLLAAFLGCITTEWILRRRKGML